MLIMNVSLLLISISESICCSLLHFQWEGNRGHCSLLLLKYFSSSVRLCRCKFVIIFSRIIFTVFQSAYVWSAFCTHSAVCRNICFHGQCSRRAGSFYSGLVWKIILLVWWICHISCSHTRNFHSVCSLGQTSHCNSSVGKPLGKPRVPRSLVNDDCRCFKNHFKTYQRSILKK